MRIITIMARTGNKTRAVLVALLVAAALSLAAEARADDPWWGEDKALHLVVSAAIGAGVHTTLWLAAGDDPLPVRLSLSAGLSLLPGLFKEIYDGCQPGNAFSGKDMLYNAAGVLAGVGLALGVELLVTRLGRDRQVSLRLGGSAVWVTGSFY